MPGIARELYRDVKAEDCPRAGRAHAQGLSRAPRDAEETFLAFTRRHEVGALKAMIDGVTRRRPHDASHRHLPSLRESRGEGTSHAAHCHGSARHHDPRDGAVLARAARLAQRLLRRAAVARCQRRCRGARRRDARRRSQGAGRRTTARPGTMRPCRSTSACSSPRASRCRASCSPPWRSRTAASAAICARPTPRPSPTGTRPSSTCASPAARRRAAC